MIALQRNLYATSIQMRQGTWNKSGGSQLYGKTIGIIGVGHVGKQVIELLKPFNCQILVNDIIDQTDYYQANNLTFVEKDAIYKASDIITIHTPLTIDTHHLIDRSVFELMKSSAFIINTARGNIIHEMDLLHALNQQLISGAALDAFQIEPLTDSPIFEHPNVFCTPHIGGNAVEAVLSMGRSAIAHLIDYFIT